MSNLIEKKVCTQLKTFCKKNDVFIERKNMGLVYLDRQGTRPMSLGKGMPDFEIKLNGISYYIECKAFEKSDFTKAQKERFWELSMETDCEIAVVNSENIVNFIIDFKEFLKEPPRNLKEAKFMYKYTFANYKPFSN